MRTNVKLSTLLAYQRCYDILRDAEMDGRKLSAQEYMDALKAKSLLDLELREYLNSIEPLELEGIP